MVVVVVVSLQSAVCVDGVRQQQQPSRTIAFEAQREEALRSAMMMGDVGWYLQRVPCEVLQHRYQHACPSCGVCNTNLFRAFAQRGVQPARITINWTIECDVYGVNIFTRVASTQGMSQPNSGRFRVYPSHRAAPFCGKDSLNALLNTTKLSPNTTVSTCLLPPFRHGKLRRLCDLCVRDTREVTACARAARHIMRYYRPRFDEVAVYTLGNAQALVKRCKDHDGLCERELVELMERRISELQRQRANAIESAKYYNREIERWYAVDKLTRNPHPYIRRVVWTPGAGVPSMSSYALANSLT